MFAGGGVEFKKDKKMLEDSYEHRVKEMDGFLQGNARRMIEKQK